ncbi:ABC transporter ATP-binding protein [Serinibacter salmoneus]|uniref:Peptide/nickel transport system ATP-binding protein n=1 Tax=Serinibacter salmoneus TaxID=556530 RepID=A0A2A9CZY0_9MICO|nr:ABC transporter ATP-binding protein [Serinibacter salmoneus]PFG19252.1 peptide/nickel transport system ATP-binding protein [Serinibacter salmoneus]
MSSPQSVLSVQDLRVTIGRREIVSGLTFDLAQGGTLGLVGESGSGKSMTVLAATGLLDAPASHVSGSSVLRRGEAETQLVGARERTLRRVHGDAVGFVFQDPSTSLNPLLTVGRQITEPLEVHRGMTRRGARARALELLEAVGIPHPEARIDSYPHQMSGGQRQRVMIAVALACDPALLVADEPTTALDVTTQAQILQLVRDLQERTGTAVIWISHDLGVIGQVADDVVVLRHGSAVEEAPVLDVFDRPQHPYTRELLAARPVLGHAGPARPADDESRDRGAGPDGPGPLLEVNDLHVTFPVSTPTGKQRIHAVQGVSFQLPRGRTLGIVGESGSGKSTIANVLTGLVDADSGAATLAGRDVLGARGAGRRALRRSLAMVFQDPFASLDPRRSVGAAVAEPLRVHRIATGPARRARIAELFDLVGLPEEFIDRYPHELSGGQRQRVSIARALALEPEVVILDESTASLDVSIQAKVLDLLRDLQERLALTYLFIAHDLAIVQQMSHEVLVMQSGKAVEQGEAAAIFAEPQQEYTRTLLAAIPPERPRAAA